MAFRTGAYATVWSVEPKGNYTDVRISTSRKRKDTGEYEQDFGGFVRMIGEANTLAAGLKERDRIRIGDCSATNTYDKAKNVTYYNFQEFSFEPVDSTQGASRPSFDPNAGVTEDMDAELPFN